MILIGSRALKLRAPHLLTRTPKDFDFVCSHQEYEDWLDRNKSKIKPKKIYAENNGTKMIVEGESICEFEIIQSNSSAEMLVELVCNDSDVMNTMFGFVPNLDLLFTIKQSHRYAKDSPHFWKTLFDWHIMREAGAKVRSEYVEFLKLREKKTYTNKLPKLNQSKKSFFADDGLIYTFIHDDIHKSVALFDDPAYLKYMKDGAEVMWDKEKFLACPREIQLAGVVEEAKTLAVERSLVPHPGVWTPEFAFRVAFSKIATSITSGIFRQFAYENVFDVLKMYRPNYWDKFQADVKNGLVRTIDKG